MDNVSNKNINSKINNKNKRSILMDIVGVAIWAIGIFLIIISARLIILPADEFPSAVTLFVVFILMPCVVMAGYANLFKPKEKPDESIMVHIFTIGLLWVVPALISIAIINEVVPKTEIKKRYDNIIEVSLEGYDGSVNFDAEIKRYRPYVFLWPFNQMEAEVGKVYYSGESFSMDECIDSDPYDFYAGEAIRCHDEDNNSMRIRLNVEKLDFVIAK